MIGNMTDAAAALASALGPCTNLYSDYGSARQVFLINGIIYKIEKECGANAAEWDRYNRIDPASLPAHIRIPEMSRYIVGDEIVIAAEFIDGEAVGECFCEFIDAAVCTCEDVISDRLSEDIKYHCDIVDLSVGNIIASHGAYYVIDLEI